ncbi:hypothetical protein [Nostoc sp. T09]|uniref:hypothetical protein n=1 Tax=Nostoc sp. T09 TaxID=1932621 RepID=UPI0015C4EE80|nr:hypothetical protein [Nostoc sp. T09]
MICNKITLKAELANVVYPGEFFQYLDEVNLLITKIIYILIINKLIIDDLAIALI